MFFLAPAALFGLALLAIPIAVHLFKPRHVRQTPFSSLRWLHLTQQRMARRIQWHQVLLFALRAAFLILVVFALARPLWSPRGGAGSVDRIIVLDNSASMGRQLAGRSTPWQTAAGLARQFVAGMLPGDRTAVLLTGHQTTVLAPWTADAAIYLPAIEAAQPTATDTNLDSSLDLLQTLLDLRRPKARVEICFLTDNMSGAWTPGAVGGFVRGLPAEGAPQLRLFDVGLPAPRNGWLTAARLRQSDRGPTLRVEASCVGDVAQPRTLRIAGLVGVKDQELSITLQPGQPTRLELPLPATFEAAGSLATFTLEPADELPEDDVLYADLASSGALHLLLIEPVTASREVSAASLPLRTAIVALADSGASAADGQLVVRSPDSLQDADIAAADVVLLADAPGLNESQAAALAARVRAGAGALFFLGPSVQPQVYNQRFTDPLHPVDGLLPAALGGAVHAAQNQRFAWAGWQERHPLLAGLVDPLIGDLPLVTSSAYYRFAGPIDPADEKLAVCGDGTPALIARHVGAGRVVWVNASADDRWCDLPRRNSFVPLVDRLLAHLAAGGERRSFDAGEAINIALPGQIQPNQVAVRTPSGQMLQPRVEAAAGRTLLRLDEPPETGFFTIEPTGTMSSPSTEPAGTADDLAENAPTAPITFVVNAGRGDSRLQPLVAESLRQWWQPADLQVEQPSAVAAVATGHDGRLALEPWLIALASLVLLAEMFLVHWLCPRINPALSSSHKRRRGFVPPLRERQETLP
ncbi:MAG: VWA domain-containing protein [Pirellulales bacterium]